MDFYYNKISDPMERGKAIHLEIEKYINCQKCQLCDSIKQIVDVSIASVVKIVRKGEMLVQQWTNTSPKKRIDWAFLGKTKYVIVDWKTGKTKNDSYLSQVQKYSSIFQSQYCRGQIWLVNVQTKQTSKYNCPQFKKQTIQIKVQNSFKKQQQANPKIKNLNQNISEHIWRSGSSYVGKKIKQLPKQYIQWCLKNLGKFTKFPSDIEKLLQYLG